MEDTIGFLSFAKTHDCTMHAWMRTVTLALVLAVGGRVCAREVPSAGVENAEGSGAGEGRAEPSIPAREDGTEDEDKDESGSKRDEPRSLHERLRNVVSHEDDPDGPINTDRPTFTPANTVVPRGRLQFESGWNFAAERSSQMRSTIYDLPELAARYGLTDRLEFRMFWSGETFNDERVRRRRPLRSIDGPGDTEVGFKWQLFPGDEKKKWIPKTALITSIIAPTGGSSPYSGETVEPYVNLIYGWNLTGKLVLCGSTGYLGVRQQGAPNLLARSDNYQRWHQSLVAFYTPAERTTFFYEWYNLMYTNAPDNRPLSFMDSGVLHRLTPNMQVDIRVGFGLTGRPDNVFAGTGFSVRF